MKSKAISIITFFFLMLALTGVALAVPRPPNPAIPTDSKLTIEPIDALLASAEIHRPLQWRGLTIFPVSLHPVRSLGDVLTLDEALSKRVLDIQEIGRGHVNRVSARNRSAKPIFLMAGETLGNAKQDRMVSEDILLPPYSRTEFAVWCIERGRWTGNKDFGSGGFLAPSTIRSRAAATKSQTDVWESVAEMQRSVGAPMGSLATVPKSLHVKSRISPYREHFISLPSLNRNTSGVIVAYGEEWIAADIFYEPSLFRQLWPKMLDSYLMEVSGRIRYTGSRSVPEAERFLGQLYWAQRLPVYTPGDGRRMELRSPAVFGSALVKDVSVVHLEAFPNLAVRPLNSAPPMLQFRRERLQPDSQR